MCQEGTQGHWGSAQLPQQLPNGHFGTGDAVVDGDAGVGGPDEAEGQPLLCQEAVDALCGDGGGQWVPLWGPGDPQAPASSYLCAASGPACTGGCRPGGQGGAAGEPCGTPQDPPRPRCPAVPPPTWCTLTIERVGASSRPSCSRTATCARCSSSAGATATGSPKLCPNQAPPSITYTALAALLAPPRSSLSPPLHPRLLTVNRTEAAPVPSCWGKATES